jgi:hypothetical protein
MVLTGLPNAANGFAAAAAAGVAAAADPLPLSLGVSVEVDFFVELSEGTENVELAGAVIGAVVLLFSRTDPKKFGLPPDTGALDAAGATIDANKLAGVLAGVDVDATVAVEGFAKKSSGAVDVAGLAAGTAAVDETVPKENAGFGTSVEPFSVPAGPVNRNDGVAVPLAAVEVLDGPAPSRPSNPPALLSPSSVFFEADLAPKSSFIG